jgi:glycosyltransferase involved in cell wall biosynthesis
MAIERAGTSPDRIVVVRNGPEDELLRTFKPEPMQPDQGRVVIGFGGKADRHDGVDHLIQVLHHLVADFRRDVECVVVGDGGGIDEARAMVERFGLTDRVRFAGPVPQLDLLRELSRTDICVEPAPSNPYNDRCTMIKIMEYMMLGKPVVAFDLPEHHVTGGDTIVYVTPNDDLAMAAAIADLIDDPARRDRLARAGRARLEESLAWRHWAPQLVNGYETLTDA